MSRDASLDLIRRFGGGQDAAMWTKLADIERAAGAGPVGQSSGQILADQIDLVATDQNTWNLDGPRAQVQLPPAGGFVSIFYQLEMISPGHVPAMAWISDFDENAGGGPHLGGQAVTHVAQSSSDLWTPAASPAVVHNGTADNGVVGIVGFGFVATQWLPGNYQPYSSNPPGLLQYRMLYAVHNVTGGSVSYRNRALFVRVTP